MTRPITTHRLQRYWPLWLLLVVVVARVAFDFWQAGAELAPDEGVYTVERVVDGDTLLLTTGTRVRLQGIDTPETVRPDSPVEPWGPEASAFTKQFVAQSDGQVRLSFSNERLDKYGRLLAFVWHGDTLLNEELVRAGLARAKTEYRYSGTMKRRLVQAEQQARDQRLGIWSNAIPAATAAE